MNTVDPTVTLAAIASAIINFNWSCCYSAADDLGKSLEELVSLDHLSRGRVVFWGWSG